MDALLIGLTNFAIYFGIALAALLIFKVVYTLFTPYDDWALVKEQNNAAACALSGAIIGFSIALHSAISNSVSLIDFGVWAVVALVAQLIAYLVVRLFMPKITQRIKDGETPAGIVLGAVSIAIGLLNAASMTY
jgi:putative membrane protein